MNRFKLENYLCINICVQIFVILLYLWSIYLYDTPIYIQKQNILNWNTNLIGDIKVQPYYLECQNDWEPMYDYVWPGTVESCDCRKYLNYYVRGTCNTTQIFQGCVNVDPIDPIKLDRWFNETRICIKRINNSSFMQTYQSYNKTCDLKKQVSCGSGQNSLCLPKGSECPIRNIEVQQQCSNNSDQVIDNYISTYQLCINRKGDNLPLVDVRFTENYVCQHDSYKKNIDLFHFDYSLLRILRHTCYDSDNRFQPILSIDEQDLYNLNKIPLDKMPNFSPQNDLYFQYIRSQIYWSQNCRNSEYINNFNDVVVNIQNKQNLLQNFIKFFGFQLMLAILLIIFTKKMNKRVYKFVLMMESVLKVLNILLILYYIILINIYADTLDLMINGICSDEYTTDQLNDIKGRLVGFSIYLIAISQLCMIFLFFTIYPLVKEINKDDITQVQLLQNIQQPQLVQTQYYYSGTQIQPQIIPVNQVFIPMGQPVDGNIIQNYQQYQNNHMLQPNQRNTNQFNIQ